MRVVLTVLATLALSLPSATAALATSELCTVSGQIVSSAVEARQAGAAKAKAARDAAGALTKAQANYRPAVGPIVSWVYSLPEEQLNADLPESYAKACEAQQAGN